MASKDEILIEQLRSDDPNTVRDAVGKIYRQYHSKMVRQVRSLALRSDYSDQDVEDIIQRSMESLQKNPKSFAYVYRGSGETSIAARLNMRLVDAFSDYRKKKSLERGRRATPTQVTESGEEVDLIQELPAGPVKDFRTKAAEAAIRAEASRMARAILPKGSLREIVYEERRKGRYGLSIEEIATHSGLPQSRIEAEYKAAREAVKAEMARLLKVAKDQQAAVQEAAKARASAGQTAAQKRAAAILQQMEASGDYSPGELEAYRTSHGLSGLGGDWFEADLAMTRFGTVRVPTLLVVVAAGYLGLILTRLARARYGTEQETETPEPAGAGPCAGIEGQIDPPSGCGAVTVVGYSRGVAQTIQIKEIPGFPGKYLQSSPVDVWSAFQQMRAAIEAQGINVSVSSAFRTMAKQKSLYTAYLKGKGNLAASPGRSNHQAGLAIDLSVTANPRLYQWLVQNAAQYGFKNTVASEKWHWEYKGKQG